LNDLETPTTPLESELSYPNTTADDIEARLLSVKGIENAFAFKKKYFCCCCKSSHFNISSFYQLVA